MRRGEGGGRPIPGVEEEVIRRGAGQGGAIG